MTEITEEKPKEEKLKLEKLEVDGDINNYDSFEFKARLKLAAAGYWDHLEGTDSEPPLLPTLKPTRTIKQHDTSGVEREFRIEGNEAEVEAARLRVEPWNKKDLKVLSMIVEAVPSKSLYLVKHSKTAKEAWDALAQEFRRANALWKTSLKADILRFHFDYGMDIMKWRAKLQDMYAQLVGLDHEALSDDEFARHLVTVIPTEGEYRFLASELHSYMTSADLRKMKMSSKYVLGKIKDEHFRLNRTGQGDRLGADVMLVPANPGQKRNSEKALINRISSSPTKRFRSGGGGALPRGDRSNLTCENKYCEKPLGHVKDNCLSYGGGKAGQYWDGYKGPTDIHHPPEMRIKLRREREIANRRDKQGARSYSANVADSSSRSNENSHTEDSVEEVNAAIPNKESFYTFAVGLDSADDLCAGRAFQFSSPLDASIYHDTGATKHVFNDRSIFDTYVEFDRALKVKGFDSSLAAAAVGKGTIKLEASCDGRKTTITLTDVLHVPAARCNLVSQSQLDRHGVQSCTGNGTIILSKSGHRFLDGHLSRDLYRLNLTPVKKSKRAGSTSVGAALEVFNAVDASAKSDFYTAY